MARSKQMELSADLPQLLDLDIAAIRDNPTQPRTVDDAGLTDKSIAELAQSIEEHGLLNPVTVIRANDNQNAYILAAGQRRLKAFQYLKRERVPAIVAKGGAREIALIENMQRRDLHPLDTAEAIGGMMREFDWTHEQLAKALSTSRVTVTEWLLLLDLPEDIRRECRALDIPKTSLVALAREKDPDKQRTLWNEVKAGKLTTRGTQRRRRGQPSEGGDNGEPAAEISRELKPVMRVFEAGHEMRNRLKKLVERGAKDQSRATVPSPEKIEELRALHKEIGSIITRFARQSQRSTSSENLAEPSNDVAA
jgi:ParB family transcriptional regulator, chromosome partitioning protein